MVLTNMVGRKKYYLISRGVDCAIKKKKLNLTFSHLYLDCPIGGNL